MKYLIALSLMVLSATSARADDPVTGLPQDHNYGKPAPGKLSCLVFYVTPNPESKSFFDQDKMIEPASLKASSGYTYIFAGAKQSGLEASDEVVTYRASSMVRADGKGNANINLYKIGAQLPFASVSGAWVTGENLTLDAYNTDLKKDGLPVTRISVSCYENTQD